MQIEEKEDGVHARLIEHIQSKAAPDQILTLQYTISCLQIVSAEVIEELHALDITTTIPEEASDLHDDDDIPIECHDRVQVRQLAERIQQLRDLCDNGAEFIFWGTEDLPNFPSTLMFS